MYKYVKVVEWSHEDLVYNLATCYICYCTSVVITAPIWSSKVGSWKKPNTIQDTIIVKDFLITCIMVHTIVGTYHLKDKASMQYQQYNKSMDYIPNFTVCFLTINTFNV